jgi:hypothetical protein
MKLPLLLVFLLAGLLDGFSQADFAGTWKGKIDAFQLTIVFHLAEKGGKLSAATR